MKNYVYLMMVLGLAACASGGEGPDSRFRVSSTSPYVFATERAAESNKALTSMNSEVVVCNGTCPAHLNRVTGTPSHARVSVTNQGGTELTVYDLSDVQFKWAEEGFDGKFTFVVNDDKQIIGIDVGATTDEINTDNVDNYTANYNITKTKNGKIYFNRNNDDTFSGLFNDNRYQENNNQEPNNNEPGQDGSNWELATYTYNSKGGDLKLQYSDFGNMTIKVNKNTTDNDDARLVFIGGYDDAKKLATVNQDITESDNFNGTATGNVTAIKNGEGSGKSLNLDGAAQLTFNKQNKETTIAATFANWYDVVYTESDNSKSAVFSNYTNTSADANYYKLISDDSSASFQVNNTKYADVDDDDNPIMSDSFKSDIRYFGDNNTPSEAVGLVQLRDCDGDGCGADYDHHNEVRMNLGFGVKKNN